MRICIQCPDPVRCSATGCQRRENGEGYSLPTDPGSAAEYPDCSPSHWSEACPTCGYLAGAHSHGCPQS